MVTTKKMQVEESAQQNEYLREKLLFWAEKARQRAREQIDANPKLANALFRLAGYLHGGQK